MKKIYIFALILFCCGIVFLIPIIYTNPAKEALTALKKVETEMNTEMSLQDYSFLLVENTKFENANFKVDLYLKNEEAKKNLELAKLIDKIMEHYNIILLIINSIKESYPDAMVVIDRESTDYLSKNSEEERIWQAILLKYPIANKPEKDGGVIYTMIGRSSGVCYGKIIKLRSLIQIILKQASIDLKRAYFCYEQK